MKVIYSFVKKGKRITRKVDIKATTLEEAHQKLQRMTRGRVKVYPYGEKIEHMD